MRRLFFSCRRLGHERQQRAGHRHGLEQHQRPSISHPGLDEEAEQPEHGAEGECAQDRLETPIRLGRGVEGPRERASRGPPPGAEASAPPIAVSGGRSPVESASTAVTTAKPAEIGRRWRVSPPERAVDEHQSQDVADRGRDDDAPEREAGGRRGRPRRHPHHPTEQAEHPNGDERDGGSDAARRMGDEEVTQSPEDRGAEAEDDSTMAPPGAPWRGPVLVPARMQSVNFGAVA